MRRKVTFSSAKLKFAFATQSRDHIDDDRNETGVAWEAFGQHRGRGGSYFLFSQARRLGVIWATSLVERGRTQPHKVRTTTLKQ
jgi:hypothetical protein